MRPVVGFVSLGCPKNLVDTERMIEVLSKNGLRITGQEAEADIMVINTCGFLDPAKEESLGTIKEFVSKKKKKKLKGVVVAGCMTERYLPLMREKFPDVDAFIRTGEFSKIGEVVEAIENRDEEKLLARQKLLGEAPHLSGHSEMEDFVNRMPGSRPFAYVKISEGCNRVCSFCIIPKLRGKHHSRSIAGIVDEIKQLVAHGTREIIFIAQDLTSYGRDLGESTSLLSLLKEVEQVEGLEWYRLMYNYPRFFSDELIEHLAKSKKFSKYLDIPFQHISDPVLKMMKRPETSDEIKTLIQKLKEKIPDLSLRTTLMVGFPGETDQDFENLKDFVAEGHFEHMGSFTYYREEGTPSAEYPDQISESIKQSRQEALMEVQKEVQTASLLKRLNQEALVRIDGLAEKAKDAYVYRGRHSGQAPEVDGVTYVSSPIPLLIGSLQAVMIDQILGDYDLVGEALVSAVANNDSQLKA